MCMLSYLPAGVGVDEDGLLNGAIANPHGHGWAIVGDGHIVLGKSLDAVTAIEEFTAAREKYSGPALFHSRLATHGSIRLNNCHPFLVGEAGSATAHLTVVGHNGILPDEAIPALTDDRSDTRLFAEEILPTRFAKLDSGKVRKRLSKWCGTFNKLVILTVDPRYDRNAYLVNESQGYWDEQSGTWHSNRDYLGRSWTRSICRGLQAKACLLCGFGDVNALGVCDVCGCCEDCTEPESRCQCWGEVEEWHRSVELTDDERAAMEVALLEEYNTTT